MERCPAVASWRADVEQEVLHVEQQEDTAVTEVVLARHLVGDGGGMGGARGGGGMGEGKKVETGTFYGALKCPMRNHMKWLHV